MHRLFLTRELTHLITFVGAFTRNFIPITLSFSTISSSVWLWCFIGFFICYHFEFLFVMKSKAFFVLKIGAKVLVWYISSIIYCLILIDRAIFLTAKVLSLFSNGVFGLLFVPLSTLSALLYDLPSDRKFEALRPLIRIFSCFAHDRPHGVIFRGFISRGHWLCII